ncbi:MAG TPA: hypothetical protein VFC26_02105 [Verrucomicrobiae bacterium]|nr:hypothetical protein [Verrucomicrobiae bacterium]
MKYLFSLITLSLLCTIALQAADQPAAKTRPFRGTIKIVNKAAQTIVLKGEKAQTFKIIPETKIRRDGKPIGFGDIVVGDTLGGFARQAPAGHWEALTLNFGAKVPEGAGSPSPSPAPAPAPKKPKAK